MSSKNGGGNFLIAFAAGFFATRYARKKNQEIKELEERIKKLENK